MDRSENHPLSPAGQVDGVGHLALGWRTNRRGRRRALRMLAALALVLVVLGALMALLS
jgi:hypothetical protein